jgi:hypothetical protein
MRRRREADDVDPGHDAVRCCHYLGQAHGAAPLQHFRPPWSTPPDVRNDVVACRGDVGAGRPAKMRRELACDSAQFAESQQFSASHQPGCALLNDLPDVQRLDQHEQQFW